MLGRDLPTTVNGTLVEAKMCTFTLKSSHFIFNKCPMYTHDGTSAKFITNSQGTDYSAPLIHILFYTFSLPSSHFRWTAVLDLMFGNHVIK
jgi:hypothetical protein